MLDFRKASPFRGAGLPSSDPRPITGALAAFAAIHALFWRWSLRAPIFEYDVSGTRPPFNITITIKFNEVFKMLCEFVRWGLVIDRGA